MTIYPTETQKNNPAQQVDVIVRSDRIGKKYSLSNGPRAAAHDFWALKSVSFEVPRGQIFGIIGRNGAGKTTLLNMIAGVLSPTEGEIFVQGRVLGLFNLGVGFQDELTGRENIFLNGAILGAARKELESKLGSIIGFSELGEFMDMPLGTYSQGMRLRLGFSIVANLDFDVLVIDEVLSVGDAIFQSKCFERLMDFKRAGKTLILTTQNLEMIERLCDKAMLLDHGKLLFWGETVEAINKYRALMNTERFYVGSTKAAAVVVENTKKWADDVTEWGKKLGTRETIISSVDFINRWGFKSRAVKSHQPLRIRVCFNARDVIKEPLFGIAVFRGDGAYCYGPNTFFDQYVIREINPGRGWFELRFKELLLAPGKYKVSVAIWDKNVILPFDYHNGFYDLEISGSPNPKNALINIPWKAGGNVRKFKGVIPAPISEDNSVERGNNENDAKTLSACLMDFSGAAKNFFRTNAAAQLRVEVGESLTQSKRISLWIGLFRDDGLYCQGMAVFLKRKRDCRISFPELPLLPGGYKFSVGIWDSGAQQFLAFQRNAVSFRMIFDREDHGTVYLKHAWEWKLPEKIERVNGSKTGSQRTL